MDFSPQPADYYRRKAARAREVKARLLDLALEYDRLADGADSATRPPVDFAGQ